jgi:hypothetical protein
MRSEHDATRVRLEGLLVGMRRTKTATMLEVQSGVSTFATHLAAIRSPRRSRSPRAAAWN